MTTEHALSTELLAAIQSRAGSPDRDAIEGVRRLSALFTVGREALKERYLTEPDLRRAYLHYFMPVNVAKVTALLHELPPLPSRALRVLDLGSGPGAGALAFLVYATQREDPAHERSVVMVVDRARGALRDAEFLWSRLAPARPGPPACAFRSLTLDLERPGIRAPWKQESFDLIIVSNSLNELFRTSADPIARRVRLLEQVLEGMAPDGTLMIIEPALRETTRELHQVRDRLVAKQRANVYSPCLHEHPCPALVRPDDWCHEERLWSPPPVVRKIDREVGFIKDALKFSYLLLRKDGLTIVDRDPAVHRVVSERMRMKGEQRVWLCNETGRQLVGRLDKSRSEANRPYDHWHRGAIVRVEQIERRGPVGRIGPSTRAELIRPVD